MSTEIITAAEMDAAALTGIAQSINESIQTIASHEGAFEEATLEHRLVIGQLLTQAHALFTMSVAAAGRLGGTAKASVSRRDTLENTEVESSEISETAIAKAHAYVGFQNWVEINIPQLKRPVAYKYKQAFAGLNLPTDAPVTAIRKSLATARHCAAKENLPAPSVSTFYRLGKPEKSKEPMVILVPHSSPELLAGDARLNIHLWQQRWYELLKRGEIDRLNKRELAEIDDFLVSARASIKSRLK